MLRPRILAFLFVFLAAEAFGQTQASATLRGRVTDPQGAVVAEAKVVLRLSGASRSAKPRPTGTAASWWATCRREAT